MKKLISIILCAITALSCWGFSVNAKAVKVKAPKLKSVTATDTCTLKITWSKIKGTKGYILYYKKAGNKFKKLLTTKKTSYTHKKLTKNKKYYYKVKAYKKIKGKKVFSKFSNMKGNKSTIYLVDLYKPYSTQGYSDYPYTAYTGLNSFLMGGEKYYNGFTLNTTTWSYNSLARFNLKGKYNYIECTIGLVDTNSGHQSEYNTFTILADDEIIKTYKMYDGDLPQKTKLKIYKAEKIEFIVEYYKGWSSMGFGNVALYK